MGGEKAVLASPVLLLRGSPPHGRGKAEQQATMDTVDRITPAWAGKRMGRFSRLHQYKDHPRMGGEKFNSFLFGGGLGGSPPHGRGKEPLCDRSSTGKGITPAWAGKRQTQKNFFRPFRDHPRMGGEK